MSEYPNQNSNLPRRGKEYQAVIPTTNKIGVSQHLQPKEMASASSWPPVLVQEVVCTPYGCPVNQLKELIQTKMNSQEKSQSFNPSGL